MPAMIQSRGEGEPHLADDLGAQLQGDGGFAPVEPAEGGLTFDHCAIS